MHWGKLRNHILEMRKKANYLVTTLDEANEAKQLQSMNGLDDFDKGGNYL